MGNRNNYYKEQVEMITNAMYRECAPNEIRTGFWHGMNRRREAMIAEFRNLQSQLHELIGNGDADDFAKNEYLDICEAIGE